MLPRISPRRQRSTWITTPWTEPTGWASCRAISKRASIRECMVSIKECRAPSSLNWRTILTQRRRAPAASMTWSLRWLVVLMPTRITKGLCTPLMVSRPASWRKGMHWVATTTPGMTTRSSWSTLAVQTARANLCRAQASPPSRLAKWPVLRYPSSRWSRRMAIEVQISLEHLSIIWKYMTSSMALILEGTLTARFVANSRQMAQWDPICWHKVALANSFLEMLTKASKNQTTGNSNWERRWWNTIVAFQSREWLMPIVRRTRPTWRTSPPSKCSPSRP